MILLRTEDDLAANEELMIEKELLAAELSIRRLGKNEDLR